MALRRALVLTAVLLAIHEGGARLLDALGVADRLLASGGGSPALAALIAAFLGARLLLYFVAPGLFVGALLRAILGRMRLAVTWRP
jgi:hypothetical protein